MRKTPLDHPYPERPHRVYVTLTNHCNRACPWCSTCSSPKGDTWLDLENCRSLLPARGPFELQLEGGEPTIHPQFWDFVALARSTPRCTRLILCTNGVVLPRTRSQLETWVADFGESFTLKISINHYLLKHDPDQIELAKMLKAVFERLGGDRSLVLNVRLRPGCVEDDAIPAKIEEAGLFSLANIFYLQRYGFASQEQQWEPPFLAGTNFSIINPDGRLFGPDLIGRSEAMRGLP